HIGGQDRFMSAAGSSADAGGNVWTSTRRGASIWAAISSWRNDHEKAQYDWDRRWCRVIGGGALLASMVSREGGPCGATANGVTCSCSVLRTQPSPGSPGLSSSQQTCLRRISFLL